MPIGVIGVALEEKEPSSALWADRRGFWQQGQSMFKKASHCVVRQHQLAMGKGLGRPGMLARSDSSRCRLHILPDLCIVCPVAYNVSKSVASK